MCETHGKKKDTTRFFSRASRTSQFKCRITMSIQNVASSCYSLFPLVALITIWLGMAGLDWTMRFQRFNWNEGLRWSPAATALSRGPMEPMSRYSNPAVRGGDLTSLAAVKKITERYGEWKPETFFVADEYGYPNEPPTDNKFYPVVVVGDSFMFVRYGEAGGFTWQLQQRLNQYVYNYAIQGRGALSSLHRFLADGRFSHRPPRVVLWGILEREISGDVFAGFVYQLSKLGQPSQAENIEAGGIVWSQLTPGALRRSLPASSILSAAVKRLWNYIQFPALGSISRDIIESLPGEDGQGFLLYRYSLEPMALPAHVRKAGQVAWAIEAVRDYLREMGIELVILLIPDKEQVYRKSIPVTAEYKQSEWPPSVLFELENYLHEKHITSINLLPTFRLALTNGERLYWRDDTHWRPEAIALAAESTAQIINPLIQHTGSTP